MTAFSRRVAELRAAAEPTRLRLLNLLTHSELTVTELTQVTGQSQPSVSRHLKVLCDAGLVERHQESAWAFFRAARGRGERYLSELGEEAFADDLGGLERVRAEREAAAQAYFAAHAEGWDALRRLHLPEAEIEAGMLDTAGPSQPVERLIDLGTGTGRMLIVFERLYEQAVGYDKSPEMLALARVKLEEASLGRAQVRRADLFEFEENPPGEPGDLVVLHQVLHFMADPERAVLAADGAARPDGRILIADFAPHDLEELCERHQHRRLGFSDAEIEGWAARAGRPLAEARTLPAPGTGGLEAKIWMIGAKTNTREADHARH